MHRLSAVVSFCALFTACGGSSEFTTGGSVAIEELPTELGRALCQAQEDCAPFFYSIGLIVGFFIDKSRAQREFDKRFKVLVLCQR